MQIGAIMNVGLDIDGVCISEYSKIFSILTTIFKKTNSIEIYLISSRENSNKSKKETIQELKELEIYYDFLILTDDKQQAIKANSIDLFIDNEIESFQGLETRVCCLLIKERMNYCWETDRFLGSKRTTKMID